jgi:hypothetical protein
MSEAELPGSLSKLSKLQKLQKLCVTAETAEIAEIFWSWLHPFFFHRSGPA